MSARISLSNKHHTLDETWEWYDFLKSSVERERERLADTVAFDVTPEGFPQNLRTMNQEEIRSHFNKLLYELDHAVCLMLFASAEAELWVDFYRRVEVGRKDNISKSFRYLWKEKMKSREKKIRVRLDELLDKWVENKPDAKKPVSAFKGLKNHRDWLSHGRYWIPKLGRKSHDPYIYKEIISRTLNVLDLRSTG